MYELDITEKKLVDVVVGVKCDMCGKTGGNEKEFTRISYLTGGWQGVPRARAYLDVCSSNCFISSFRQIKDEWGDTVSINNVSFNVVSDLAELFRPVG